VAALESIPASRVGADDAEHDQRNALEGKEPRMPPPRPDPLPRQPFRLPRFENARARSPRRSGRERAAWSAHHAHPGFWV